MNYVLIVLYLILYAIATVGFYEGSLLIAGLAVVGVGVIVAGVWLAGESDEGEEEWIEEADRQWVKNQLRGGRD